jgi:hypothetical protein
MKRANQFEIKDLRPIYHPNPDKVIEQMQRYSCGDTGFRLYLGRLVTERDLEIKRKNALGQKLP